MSSEFIVEVIQKIPASRLVQSKRLCMKDLVNSRLFHLGECRAILLPVFCQQIRDKLDSNEEVSVRGMCGHSLLHLFVVCVCVCAFVENVACVRKVWT